MCRPSPQGGQWLACVNEDSLEAAVDPGDALVMPQFLFLKRGTMLPSETANGSEGDAYRYTKKVLMTLPNRARIKEIYAEIAAKKNISSWTRAAYMDLRAHFFKDGQCKIRFAPGAARIAFGTLELGTGDEQLTEIGNFHDILRIISIAHSTEYTRHLAPNGKEPLAYQELLSMYGATVTKDWSALKRKLKRRKYGERRYKIIELDSFETANKYYEYTQPNGWCHLQCKSTFDHYRHVDTSRFTGGARGLTNMVRLYLAVLPGFETMSTEDEMYGESMLGIDIGPGGRLVHVNNRWNHAHDYIDHRKGDNKYDELELSELLGGPFFELCPPYSVADERAAIKAEVNRIKALNKKYNDKRKSYERILNKGIKCGKDEIGHYVDPRDNNHYRTRRIGGIECMLDPIRYVPSAQVYNGAWSGTCMIESQQPTHREFYMFTIAENGGFVRRRVDYNAFVRVAGDDFLKNIDIFPIDRNPYYENDIEIIFNGSYQVIGRIGEDIRTYDVGMAYYALFLTNGTDLYIPFDELVSHMDIPYNPADPDAAPTLMHPVPDVTKEVSDKLTSLYKELYPGKPVPEWKHVDYLLDIIDNCHVGSEYDMCEDFVMETNDPSASFGGFKLSPHEYDTDPVNNQIMKAFSRSYKALGKVSGITRTMFLVNTNREISAETIEMMNAEKPGNNGRYDNGQLIVYGLSSVAEALPPGWRTPTIEDLYRIVGGLNENNKADSKISDSFLTSFYLEMEDMHPDIDAVMGQMPNEPKPKPTKKKRVGGAQEIPRELSERDKFARIILRSRLKDELFDVGYSSYVDELIGESGRVYFPMFYECADDPSKRLENSVDWFGETPEGRFRYTVANPTDVDDDGHVLTTRCRMLKSIPFFVPYGVNRFLSMDHETHMELEKMRFMLFPVRD
jgi:hypothetical protein